MKDALFICVGIATLVLAMLLAVVSAPRYGFILTLCLLSAVTSAFAWFPFARRSKGWRKFIPSGAIVLAFVIALEAALRLFLHMRILELF
jgi:hypothetical protein